MTKKDEIRNYLTEVQKKRGYTLEMHKVMANADIKWAKDYDQFIEACYTNPRSIDRKTKELLQIVVETALRAEVPQIQAHIRVALNEGASPQEILEALQTVTPPMGVLAFRHGLEAWVAETGFKY